MIDTHTPIIYLHFTLESGGRITQVIPANHNALVYVIRGEAALGSEGVRVREGQLAVLGEGAAVTVAGAVDAESTELLLLAGRPIGEPLSRYGPFVMNTDEQIRAAIADYRAGRMGAIRH